MLINEAAILLTAPDSSVQTARVEQLLRFFGKEPRRLAARGGWNELLHAPQPARIIGGSAAIYTLLTHLKQQRVQSGKLAECVHSIFVYPEEGGSFGALLEALGIEQAQTSTTSGTTEWQVADGADSVGSPMRGLAVSARASGMALKIPHGRNAAAASLLTNDSMCSFLRIDWQGVPVFLTTETIIDPEAELTTPNFDVRDHLLAAYPIVAYIRWAFPQTAWHAAEGNACLVIDDPLLKSRYGFIRFKDLLRATQEHHFSTSIAFIPWNWRRSSEKVLQLFRTHPEKLSICIHGCDHTRGEFGGADSMRLARLARQAMQRMEQHEQATGLAHDRVMVFPQGVFSEQALAELRNAGFEAVVNTEVHPVPASQKKLRLLDIWAPAVTAYGGLPLYTRRYPTQGVANFAFDLLLGKPCLVVIHHDFWRDGGEELLRFIDRLNNLGQPLQWQRLSEVVRRSYRQRLAGDGATDVEVASDTFLLENKSSEKKEYSVRLATGADGVGRIYVNGRPAPFEETAEGLAFRASLGPGEHALVGIERHRPGTAPPPLKTDAAGAAKVALRRYLSEVRDNYLAPARAMFSAS